MDKDEIRREMPDTTFPQWNALTLVRLLVELDSSVGEDLHERPLR